jgi:hypothetical protein
MRLGRLYVFTVPVLGVLFNAVMALAGSNISLLASNFDRTEVSTSGDITKPLSIYDNTVMVPASNNVLLISISGGAEVSASTTDLYLNCQVDGTTCASSAAASNIAPPGWTGLDNAVSKDSSLSYTWCTPLKKNGKGKSGLTHEVTLSMASSDGTSTVAIEAMHVSIEAVMVKDTSNACTAAGFPTM